MMEEIGPGLIPSHAAFLDGVVEHLEDLQRQEETPLSAESWERVYRAARAKSD